MQTTQNNTQCELFKGRAGNRQGIREEEGLTCGDKMSKEGNGRGTGQKSG